jgi:hypothetical protein
MPKTYDPIASTTLGSAQSTITMANISQNYTDLIVIPYLQATANDVGVGIYFNSDNGNNNYSRTWYRGWSTAVGSTRSTDQATIGNLTSQTGAANNLFNAYHINIMDYTSTNKYKTLIYQAGNMQTTASNTEVGFGAGLWRSTAAITSLTFVCGGASTFTTGSNVTIYGIRAA